MKRFDQYQRSGLGEAERAECAIKVVAACSPCSLRICPLPGFQDVRAVASSDNFTTPPTVLQSQMRRVVLNGRACCGCGCSIENMAMGRDP